MRPVHDCFSVTILRIFVGSLAAVVLVGMNACGEPEEDASVQAKMLPPVTFDLAESGFHQSTVEVGLSERVELLVEVRQDKHDRHICGVPSLVDPFGNILQTLTPWQNIARETEGQYVYESRYAFIAATDGYYAVKLENQPCLIDEVAAVATVQWTVYPGQERSP